MWHTALLSALAGTMGANAIPHFVKGMVGEQFPNLLGNDPVRNALAGTVGLAISACLGYWAHLPDHPLAGLTGLFLGALPMAIFHGRGGAYRLNTAAGRPNPPHTTPPATA
ncbi:hypothetical protein [Nocardia wallacei]|uniref:hypothetical protein n=1 Tax=Nocardia wallacei TaxID=480035 RepID=UPI0024554F9C|nr:hypothetical protein [Nocardia wallacei]